MQKDLLQSASIALLMLCGLSTQALANDAPKDAPLVDRKAGVPTVLAFDTPAGSFNYVLDLVAPDEEEEEKSLRIHLSAPTDVDWAAGHWYPTTFLCLKPAGRDSKQSYCTNVTFDDAKVAFGTARLVSEQGEEMFLKLTTRRFDAQAPMRLQIVRKGTHVTTTIEGEVVDEGDIDFVPEFWMIGASTGTARIEVLAEPESEIELAPGQWPRTLEAAVDEAISHMSAASQRTFREMPMEDLAKHWIGWGTSLRDRQGLSRGTDGLRKAACGMDCAADAAAKAIMEAVWRKLQEQPGR